MTEFLLREHQRKAISFINNKKVSLLEMFVGSGKTFIMLHLIEKNHNFKFIVLVHKKDMIRQWENEMMKIYNKTLPNVKILAYTTEIKKNLECDCLIIDEFHFLKKIGTRWKNAFKIKWKKTIWLSGTPVESLEDWYAYFKFMKKINSKKEFYDIFEAFGHNAVRPNMRYAKYINYKKTPNFKIDGLNIKKLNYELDKFKLTITRNVLENLRLITLNKMEQVKKDYISMRTELHDISKEEKIKQINDSFYSGIVIVSYNVEKEYLRKKLNDDFWIINYREAELTGTDGLQHKYNNIIFWTPPASKSRIIQAIGRIDREGQEKQINVVGFISNQFERQLWNKTLSKQIMTKNF